MIGVSDARAMGDEATVGEGRKLRLQAVVGGSSG